ncbi:MAG TPA: hypothetical protein VJ650_15075 [Gemmatimonadaceae bacterium]|nr:hypothetical protein [Gemmatimonadaceae bacterium]
MKRLIGILGVTIVGSCSSPMAPTADLRSEPRWASLGKACGDDAPAPSLSADKGEALPLGWDVNAQWAAIARRVPGGWGGVFLENGIPTIYLVDPAQREAAIAALAAEGFALTSPRVKKGRWDFAQLYDWFRYLARHTVAIEGVSYIDIQEARNWIEYGVVDEPTRAHLEEILAPLDVPCFLVAIGIRPHAVPR